MTNTTTRKVLRNTLKPLVVAVAMASAMPAHAVRFDLGEVQGQFDSQMSIGASWGTSNIDDDLVAANNGGNANALNSDDNRLNFDKGETFSKIFKGIHDLSLQYGDTGVFLRGKYWYDFELKDEHRNLYDISDDNRKVGAQSSGVQLLDAFVYHSFSIGDKPGSIRAGKQVVSWGESTFIQNGINSINPIDVAAFRRPGAEVKEGLIPVNMLYLSQSLTDNLGIEMFYQLEWDQTVLDNCGTFFSFTDTVADGCNYVGVGGSQNGKDGSPIFAYVPRAADRDARDDGQFGVSLRYFAENLNQTEFGFYAMNYHSRNPIYSTSTNGVAYPAAVPVSQLPGVNAGGSYFIEYPEDIDLYGISINTTLPTGTSLGAEYSFRPNLPIQWNTFELIYGGLQQRGPDGQVVSKLEQRQREKDPNFNYAGKAVDGYDRYNVSQAQATFIHFIDRVMGAARFIIVGEVGATYIHDLPSTSEARYGRSGIYGVGPVPLEGDNFTGDYCSQGTDSDPRLNINPSNCGGGGFTTSFSWGYRTLFVWDYPDAVAGVNLRPRLFFSHDVKGYAPDPGGNFQEGNKSLGLAVEATYQNAYKANLSYTNYFGGDYNVINDRDFVSASVSYSF